jgi:hypothetical protein
MLLFSCQDDGCMHPALDLPQVSIARMCRSGACFIKSTASPAQLTPATSGVSNTAVLRAFMSVTAGTGGPAPSQQPAQLQVLCGFYAVTIYPRWFKRFGEVANLVLV